MSTTRRELLVSVALLLAVVGALAAMDRVFTDAAWLRPSVAAATLAMATAVGARRAGLPAFGSLLLTIAGLVVFTYVVHLPAGPLIPGREELEAARQLLEAGLIAARDQPAPVEPLPELVFLVTLAVWWVSFVTHEVAVRLRRPAGALIVPATLWVVPLAMPQPTEATWRNAVWFLLGCALVLLLESDADLAGWARERIAPRITVAGAAVAAVAVGVGTLAPGLLPGYREPAWLDLGGSSDPRGYQPIVDIGDRLNLPSDRAVLRVASDRRTYLRLAALDTFDGNTWRLGPPGSSSFVPDQSELYPGDQELLFETAIANADTTVVDVEVLDLENIYVPVPYQPVQVNGDAADEMVWSRVGGFLATGELTENELGGTLRTGVVPGLTYQVVAAIPDPTIDQLRTAEPDPTVVAPWLSLPGGSEPWARYAEQAQQVYDAAGVTSAADKALALQYWFTTSGGFEYALSGIEPLRGPNPLEAFVFDTRTGYCEYYATAMAVMLRATGVPARVAVGFLPGTRIVEADPDRGIERDVYEVRTGDAHAWVEVLFPGEGWIKFDPTPRTDALAPVEGDLDPELTPEEQAQLEQELAETFPDPTDAPTTPTTPELPEDQPDLADDGATGDEGRSPVLAVVAGLLTVAALAAVLSARRREHDPPDGAAAALVAQRRVLHEAARLGIGRHESETATEALHRWASDGRCDPTLAAGLAATAQRAAFARTLPDGAGQAALTTARQLVAQLRASAERTDVALAPVRLPLTWGRDRATALASRARERFGTDLTGS